MHGHRLLLSFAGLPPALALRRPLLPLHVRNGDMDGPAVLSALVVCNHSRVVAAVLGNVGRVSVKQGLVVSSYNGT